MWDYIKVLQMWVLAFFSSIYKKVANSQMRKDWSHKEEETLCSLQEVDSVFLHFESWEREKKTERKTEKHDGWTQMD